MTKFSNWIMHFRFMFYGIYVEVVPSFYLDIYYIIKDFKLL